MNTVETLQEIKRRLLAGPASKTWERGGKHFNEKSGPGCVIAHLIRIENEEGRCFDDLARMSLYAASNNYNTVYYNDEIAKGLWDILAMLNRAIEYAQAHEVPPTNPPPAL